MAQSESLTQLVDGARQRVSTHVLTPSLFILFSPCSLVTHECDLLIIVDAARVRGINAKCMQN